MDMGVPVTETDSGAFASYKVPVHADFLISHSTIGIMRTLIFDRF